MPSRSPPTVLNSMSKILVGVRSTLFFDVASGTKIYAGQTVTLSYDKTLAGADALEDAAGNEVATFTDFPVTNNSGATINTCLAPNLAGRTQIWTGTVTVGARGTTEYGFSSVSGLRFGHWMTLHSGSARTTTPWTARPYCRALTQDNFGSA